MILCNRSDGTVLADSIILKREIVMDNKKKKIIVIIIATVISLVSSIVACLLGVEREAFDKASISTEIVDVLAEQDLSNE